MAKFIKRIGTKAFKYHIEVAIEKVQLDFKENCQIFILWQRGIMSLNSPINHYSSGPRKIETKRVDFDVNAGYAFFKDKLNLTSTLYYDTKTKKYLEKKVLSKTFNQFLTRV